MHPWYWKLYHQTLFWKTIYQVLWTRLTLCQTEKMILSSQRPCHQYWQQKATGRIFCQVKKIFPSCIAEEKKKKVREIWPIWHGANASTCERSQKCVIKRPRGRPKETGRVKSCATTDDDENESLTEDDVV